MATVQQVTRGQFAEYLRGVRISRVVAWVVDHHTWRPTAAQYRGRPTIQGVTRYHVEHNGWRDNGYHVMIGPDGSIWLCRPMAQSGAHCVGRNHDSIGVSLVLDGDREQFWGTPQHEAFVAVLAMLCKRFNIDPATHMGPHSRWANKTCPGVLITRQWSRLVRDVKAVMHNSVVNEPLVVLLPGHERQLHGRLIDGDLWVPLRRYEALRGGQVHAQHLSTQGKVYVIGGES